ncbi:MAG: DUF202 domain-containing protein [Micromonosporaceae bacterium]
MTRAAGPGRDPGLQPERTRLAWRRTALAVTGVALLAARLAVQRVTPVRLLGLVAVAALWAAVLAVSHHRVRALAPPRPAPGDPSGRALPALALIVTGYAVLGVLLVLA